MNPVAIFVAMQCNMCESKALYDRIGRGYNATRQADPFITEKLFQLLSPHPSGLYLDLGCGTGNYTIALARRGLHFYGIEPSGGMMDIARLKNDKINWILAKAENIPLNDNLFDGALATLTIHHWSDIKKAFEEVYRVLKKSGNIIFFTATPEQMEGYWLHHYFPKMMNDSILQMPSFDAINDALAEAGFMMTDTEKYFIQDNLKDNFLYVGKHRPEIYFDEGVRNGISSFSVLANRVEVMEGLSQLEDDLRLGRFEAVKERFKNDLGDYLFITAKKN